MENLENIQERIEQRLAKYIREKNTPEIRYVVKSDLMGLLRELESTGHFSYDFQMPIIDINHEEEIKAIEEEQSVLYKQLERCMLYNELQENPCRDEYYKISNKMAFKSIALQSLKDQIQDPNSFIISFKVPVTFDLYTWDK